MTTSEIEPFSKENSQALTIAIKPRRGRVAHAILEVLATDGKRLDDALAAIHQSLDGQQIETVLHYRSNQFTSNSASIQRNDVDRSLITTDGERSPHGERETREDPPKPADSVVIHTDGACSRNPGAGGWGAQLRFSDSLQEVFGGEHDTTSNRMELMAAITSLESLEVPCEVELFTDSLYVCDGITKWIINWQKNDWRTAKKKAVMNKDLWQRLLVAAKPHDIDWQWVKGHSGDPGNERADALANKGMAKARRRNG